MFALKKRKGFALPLAILLLAVLTASIAAGFAATSGEIVSNNAQRAQDRAYQIAEAGLQQFMVRRNEAGFCSNCAADPLLADSEYTRVDIPGGYADVVSFRIRPRISDTIPAIYFIRSKGVDMTVRLRASTSSGSNTTNFAERTVGQYATWNTSTVRVIGAWTSLSGVTKNGTAGEISGIDQCNPGGPQVAGVTVPAGGNLTTSGNWSPTGTPPADTTSTLDSLKSRAGIDWNGIINQNSMPADYTVPGNGFPTAEQFNDTSFWPVIRIKTNGFSLPHAGRGIIIADSNFTISGSNMWDGILMVGGKLTSNGNNTTAGATLSGLNMMLPGAVSPGPGETSDDATANGQKTYVYSSCKVSRAAQRLRVYFSLANTWMDNVAVW